MVVSAGDRKAAIRRHQSQKTAQVDVGGTRVSYQSQVDPRVQGPCHRYTEERILPYRNSGNTQERVVHRELFLALFVESTTPVRKHRVYRTPYYTERRRLNERSVGTELGFRRLKPTLVA